MMTRPVGPIEGALALSVVARRAVRRARRRLLPGAPFLGLAPRRRVSRAAAWRPRDALAWRAPSDWSRQPAPAASRTHEVLRRERMTHESARTTTIVSPPSPAPARALATAITTAPRTHAARAAPATRLAQTAAAVPPVGKVAEPSSRPPPLTGAEEARGLAVAPALVWFARWEAVRLTRTVQDQRSATFLAPDGVRRRVAAAPPLARPARESSAAFAAAAAPVAAPGRAEDEITLSPADRPLSASRRLDIPTFGGPHGPLPPRWIPILTWIHGSAPARDRGSREEPLAPPAPLVAGLPSLAGSAVAAGPAGKVLTVVSEVLERGVASRVREEVAQAMKRLEAARPAPASPARRSETLPATTRVDDRLAGAMIDRIRGLLREERFRHGLLR